jgi:hypothetical protein
LPSEIPSRFAVDEKGQDLTSQRAAEIEALLSLAAIKELEGFVSIDRLPIEVSDDAASA